MNKVKFSVNPAGNPVIEFDYMLNQEEEQALTDYIESIRKMGINHERERIIKLLEERKRDYLYDAEVKYVIDLIREGEEQ